MSKLTQLSVKVSSGPKNISRREITLVRDICAICIGFIPAAWGVDSKNNAWSPRIVILLRGVAGSGARSSFITGRSRTKALMCLVHVGSIPQRYVAGNHPGTRGVWMARGHPQLCR